MVDATFDGDNLIITLPSGEPIIDVEADLYSAWKRFMLADKRNMRFPAAFRTIGGDNLTPGIDAGAYFFLQNDQGWRIRPAEEDATVLVTGNLAPEDSSLPMTIPTLGGFTVLLQGLQPITQSVESLLTDQQNTAYNGTVFINTFTGTTGTDFPAGTASDPVDNLADALTILAERGFSQISLVGSITLTSALTFKKIFGQIGVAVVSINGQNVSGTQFERCSVFGDFALVNPATPAALFQCIIAIPIDNFVGNLGECLIGANVSLQAGQTNVNRCLSNVPGVGKPCIDFQGLAVDLSCRSYTGGLEIQNATNALSDVSVDMSSGRLLLNANCTAGTFVVGGVGTLENNATGITLNKNSLIDGLDIKLIKALDAGNITITGANPFVVTVLDPDDNVTVLGTWEISADGKTRTRTS